MYWCTCVCFFKQKTAYEMRISDWSSDVCSSDLAVVIAHRPRRKTALIVFARFVELDGEAVLEVIEHIFPGRDVDRDVGPFIGGNFSKAALLERLAGRQDRKSTRLNSSH